MPLLQVLYSKDIKKKLLFGVLNKNKKIFLPFDRFKRHDFFFGKPLISSAKERKREGEGGQRKGQRKRIGEKKKEID